MTTNSAAALINNGESGGAYSKIHKIQTEMAKSEKLPLFVKDEENKKPVACTFADSGVHYGYAYNAGEEGIVREGDVAELVKRKVIINPRPVTEKATAKTGAEKATA